MSISPELHAGFLAGAVIGALLFAGIILARNPRSTPARLHAVYGGLVAWWLFCMAIIAVEAGPSELWTRLLHVSIGMLPGVMFHLNVSTAGVEHQHRQSIRFHYAASAAMTAFGLFWPMLLNEPNSYSWGPYPAYTAWGLIPVAFLAVVFLEIIDIYSKALHRGEKGSAYREKVAAFRHGNMLAFLALVDFLPAFGIGVYPFGFAVMSLMHAATVFGSIRFRLIEITPEFAAEDILQTLPDAVFVIDSQGLVRVANDAAARTVGPATERRALLNQPLRVVAPNLAEHLLSASGDHAIPGEITIDTGESTARVMRVSSRQLCDQRHEPVGRVWVLHDVTDQRAAEAEKNELEGWIRQGQKLETLGSMAGGIAHDFNNLLMAISASAELALHKQSNGTPVDKHLETIVVAADHAKELTGQMLTYAGQGPTVERAVDLNELARGISELIESAIAKKAKLELEFADDLPLVTADRSQMSQVLLNLITNASDALGDEFGTITVRTGVLDVDGTSEANAPDAPHVFLEVADTGAGIDPATKERMFDPFYTTKFAGRGLGLATVMGIVEAHDGRIRVDTEPGQGTTFTIALPAARTGPVEAAAVPSRAAWTATGLALLADDEPAIRAVASQLLNNAGFDVVEAADGKEAVALFEERREQISVVLLDVTMPEMDGREARRRMRALNGSVPIVLMSGYAHGAAADELAADARTWFLHKPFHTTDLLDQLREAMADAAAS